MKGGSFIKSLLVIISSLMILLGGLFSAAITDGVLDCIAKFVNYDSLNYDEQFKLISMIVSLSEKGFAAFIIGVCLLMATLTYL